VNGGKKPEGQEVGPGGDLRMKAFEKIQQPWERNAAGFESPPKREQLIDKVPKHPNSTLVR
jgi:hypothetical protein